MHLGKPIETTRGARRTARGPPAPFFQEHQPSWTSHPSCQPSGPGGRKANLGWPWVPRCTEAILSYGGLIQGMHPYATSNYLQLAALLVVMIELMEEHSHISLPATSCRLGWGRMVPCGPNYLLGAAKEPGIVYFENQRGSQRTPTRPQVSQPLESCAWCWVNYN